MAILEPRCDSCGLIDAEAKAALLGQGKLNYGNSPNTRAPLYCLDCRAANSALIQAFKAAQPEPVEKPAETPVSAP